MDIPIVRDPGSRTTLLGALFAAAVMLTAVVGSEGGAGAEAGGATGSTGEGVGVSTTVLDQPSTTATTLPSPSTSASSAAPQTSQPSVATSTPGSDDQSVVVEDAGGLSGGSDDGVGPFQPVRVAGCTDIALRSGDALIVGPNCLGATGAFGAAPTYPLRDFTVRPDSGASASVALVVAPGALRTNPVQSPNVAPMVVSSDRLTVVASAAAVGRPVEAGAVVAGWLPCAGGACDVTVDPRAVPKIALALLTERPGSTVDQPFSCSETATRLAMVLEPSAFGDATTPVDGGADPRLACGGDVGPVQGFDDDGCVEDPRLTAGGPSPVGPYELRVVDIGLGVDAFEARLTLPATERWCLDRSYSARELWARYRTVLVAEQPIGELLTPTGVSDTSEPTGGLDPAPGDGADGVIGSDGDNGAGTEGDNGAGTDGGQSTGDVRPPVSVAGAQPIGPGVER
ncbi:MAG: hypothetical protein AAF547_05415 [Actinomycetota bacterium]